jgi:hypothetical protein
MTDLVLPASAPIETYIDETVSVLAELMEDTPKDVLAGFDFSAQGVWAFARPGAPPLKADESLDDAGVVDGSLLTLVSVSRTERYRPLVEDVIDAIAVLDESPEFDRTALNRFVGLAIPVAALAITVMSMVAWSRTGHSWYWPVALGVLGLAVLGGTLLAKNGFGNIDMAESLFAAAVPVLAGAVALAVPLPRGVASLGAPQIAGAGAVVILLTLATRGGPRRRAELASFMAVTSIAVTAAAIAYGYGWQYWVPAGAIAVVVQGHFFIHGLIVAGLVVVICGFRSRLYAERWCAWALLAAAVIVPTGVLVRLCLWYPHKAWLVLTIYTAAAIVALITVGATEGVRRVSPVTKRILELSDGAAIAAVIPLLVWIASVYDVLRNLRF